MLLLNFYIKDNSSVNRCRKENCFHLNFYFRVNVTFFFLQKMNQMLKFTSY